MATLCAAAASTASVSHRDTAHYKLYTKHIASCRLNTLHTASVPHQNTHCTTPSSTTAAAAPCTHTEILCRALDGDIQCKVFCAIQCKVFCDGYIQWKVFYAIQFYVISLSLFTSLSQLRLVAKVCRVL